MIIFSVSLFAAEKRKINITFTSFLCLMLKKDNGRDASMLPAK